MLTLLRSLFTLPAHEITAAPSQNLTVNQVAPTWVPNPNGRGSSDILYSCASTLVLCVWNSVHLNIPTLGEDDWTTYRRKAKWVTIALLAPELLVFTAFQQWLAARKFLHELGRVHSERPSELSNQGMFSVTRRLTALQNSEYLSRKQEFNMSYAMYAVMGGFAVDISMLHNTLEHAALTTNGLLLLARRGFDQHLDRELIPDKSKVDLLAKALVLLQIIGVVGQFIERKAEKLPVSLVEYHTVIHVVCAIAMYLLWIRKPFDIKSPTVVNHGEWFNELAYMVASSNWAGCSGFEEQHVSSKVSKWLDRCSQTTDPPLVWFGNLFKEPEILSASLLAGTSSLDRYCPHVITHCLRGRLPPKESWVIGQHGTPEPALDVAYYPVTKVGKTFVPAKGLEPLFFVETGQALTTGFGPYDLFTDKDDARYSCRGYRVGISHNDLRRLEGAAAFCREIVQLPEGSSIFPILTEEKETGYLAQLSNSFSGNTFRIAGPPLVCHRAMNCAGFDELFDCLCPSSAWFWFTFVAAISIPGIYGGVHLVPGFQSPFLFATTVELTLWKASCVLLLASTGLCLLWVLTYGLIFGFRSVESLYTKYKIRKELELSSPQETMEKVLKILSCFGIGVFVWLSFAARAFIVIESFISLRHVPSGVYQTTDKSFISWIPHLS